MQKYNCDISVQTNKRLVGSCATFLLEERKLNKEYKN